MLARADFASTASPFAGVFFGQLGPGLVPYMSSVAMASISCSAIFSVHVLLWPVFFLYGCTCSFRCQASAFVRHLLLSRARCLLF